MSEQPLIEVDASPTFNRNLRILVKKYRNIRSDIQPQLQHQFFQNFGARGNMILSLVPYR